MSKTIMMDNGKMVCMMEMVLFIGKMVNIILEDIKSDKKMDLENLNFIQEANIKEIGPGENSKGSELSLIGMDSS